MADREVEHELCGNCKREIPQRNYVMHTAHCARNITLCQVCKEPIPKADYPDHAKKCVKKSPPKEKTPEPPRTNLEKSDYYKSIKEIQDKKNADRRERYMKRHEYLVNQTTTSTKTVGSNPHIESSSSVESSEKTTANAYTWGNLQAKTSSSETTKVKNTNMVHTAVGTTSKVISNGTGAIKKEEKKTNGPGAVPKPSSGLMPCRYCELDLPKIELEEHENYCGSRTDKCLECGEFVMFKHKQAHIDTNHGFVKKDDSAQKPSWESTTQKSHSPPRTRRVFSPSIYTDLSQFDATDYLPSNYRMPKPKIEKGESYKEISRRLDCKTEYIRNLLHDSASITVPLRHSGAVPRNHFNHNKGPPPKSRRNPPSELCIPCEFCDTPIPHLDYVEHERGCRPDKFFSKSRARNFDFDEFEARPPSPTNDWKNLPQSEPTKPARRKRHAKAELVIPCEFCNEPIPEDDLIIHQTGCRPDLARYSVSGEASASTPEVELPCEFCADMFPASQLFRHQATCN